MSVSTRSKAGRSAWREHRRRLLPWGIFGLVFAVVCFSFVGLSLNGRMGSSTELLVFLLLAAVYVLWNRNMDSIDRRWGEGARGESEVGRELERLHEEGFYVFHDWDSGKGNVDHFVVGPQGVFVVETKALSGEITCEDRRLLRDGRPVPGKDVLKQAMGEAMAVRELVKNSTGVEAFVHPVLCFNKAKLSYYKPVGNVEIANPGSLNRIIVDRRDRYSAHEVKAISRLLEKKLGTSPAAGPELPPEKPTRVAAFLSRDRNLILVIILFFVILTAFFPETTATFFDRTADVYRAIGSVVR